MLASLVLNDGGEVAEERDEKSPLPEVHTFNTPRRWIPGVDFNAQ